MTPETREAKGFRIDLAIAVCALLVSSLATAASWWQSRVVAQQLSAQVWPYISFTATYESDTATLAVANDGLGPAVLRTAVVTVDGVAQRSLLDAVHAMLGAHLAERARRAGNQPLTLALASAGPGSVLRAGASVTVLQLRSKLFAPLLARATPRLRLRACYCSIAGECFTKDSRGDDPRPVGACPAEPMNLLLSRPQVTPATL